MVISPFFNNTALCVTIIFFRAQQEQNVTGLHLLGDVFLSEVQERHLAAVLQEMESRDSRSNEEMYS